ncbi:MAG TPA: heavy-metal-associated domain-containing protein [Thermoleophilia bacterium]|nr:heavy-metal-associated domain-containing protein [Thermoleophilia bacterium]
MEQVTVSIPSLWADHHVLAVRDILCSLSGVAAVDASALRHLATVSFDPTAIAPERLAESLVAGGYPPDVTGEEAESAPAAAWSHSASRATVTNPIDLAMSGDYRKY